MIPTTRLRCRGILEARILTQRRGDAETQKSKEGGERMTEREVAKIVAFAAIFAHRERGEPGLLEAVTRVNASLSLPFCASASLRLCVKFRRPCGNDATGVPMCSMLAPAEVVRVMQGNAVATDIRPGFRFPA